MQILLHSPKWSANSYQLLDSGAGYKLERFGENVLCRPEPQALWQPSLSQQEWEKLTSATFVRKKGESEKGEWKIGRKVAEQWWVKRKMESGTMRLRLGMTSFKHVGLFAEQAANWDYIENSILKLRQEYGSIKMLNMFAYTGAASVAGAMAGAAVTHLDSVKAVNHWARENAEASGVDGIRYITDDAMEFAARECRRENRYSAIVLDPPAYGRGPDGQKWVLEDHIYELLLRCKELLATHKGAFMLLSLYSMGFSALLTHTLLRQILGEGFDIEASELFVSDSFGKALPLGMTLRVVRK
ncbi:MAG: class I SAM-dependent methyltransferase [Rikenellaceae bacterium]